MQKILIFGLILLGFSCKGKQKDSQISIINDIADTIALNDTLKDPYSYHYLANLTPREFAELIMKDSIRPSDNFNTFRVMDSLKAKS